MESPDLTYSDDSARSLIRAASTTHLLNSKAQWDKTKPKGRCQCHAWDEHEGQGQNCSYVHGHGNHPSSTMFGAGATLWGCDQRQTHDRNRREVSNEKRCHRYLQSDSLERCGKNRRKAVPYVTTEIGGEMELFPVHEWLSATALRIVGACATG
jgi:hypothetical protein